MQKWWGKAWEKESRVWCQVDVRGWCLMVVTHKLCVDQPQVYRTSCIDAVFRMLQSRTRYYKKDPKILRRASPLTFSPHIYLTSHTRFFLPGLSPSVFAYCKRSKTGGGNGRGPRLTLAVCSWPKLIPIPDGGTGNETTLTVPCSIGMWSRDHLWEVDDCWLVFWVQENVKLIKVTVNEAAAG